MPTLHPLALARTLRRPCLLGFVGSALTDGWGMALSAIAVTGAGPGTRR